jgi:hypothetical protein
MGGLDAITEIVKERYQTGAYGNAHFVMSRSVLEAAKAAGPPPAPRMPWEPRPLGDLLTIPVKVDDSMPNGAWRLVDNSTDEVLRSGGAPEVSDGRPKQDHTEKG